MKILVIGGTRFLGRHLVDSALARGHEVTLFNRGLTNPDLFPQVETILGDREKDFTEFLCHEWDAVVDTCGYVPRVIRLSAAALEGCVERYVFISSISVYPEFGKIGINESDSVAKMEDETVEEITGETYGPLKALCEQTVQEVFGGQRALIVRPGLIVGPYDPTDRFTYWPVRVARGGDVLAPEGPDAPVQIIDARDLSDFIIELIEEHASSIFNATGPDYELTMGTLLETCKQVSHSDANFRWAPVEFLSRHEVAPWSDMPVWIPNTEEDAGFARIDISKAIEAGLKFRPLEETVRATLEWAMTRRSDREWRAGLSAEREATVLAALEEE
jgi:2'-hydroxyisoflavone reductase